MPPKHHLGELQLAIIRVLWARGEATAAEVHEALVTERGLALTTIATMLRKMEDKGVVRHRTRGRSFVYRPSVSQDAVHRTMVGDLVARLFDGDPKALVHHLVQEGEVDFEELEQLRRELESDPGSHERGGRGAR